MPYDISVSCHLALRYVQVTVNKQGYEHMKKSLDDKLARIRAGAYSPEDFIIADAKDSNMGRGITALAQRQDGSGENNTFLDHLQAIRQVTDSRLTDVMLMSVSAAERLVGEGVFSDSPVTPAVRLNDATDVWGPRNSSYKTHPARDFRTAKPERIDGLVDLGLYSITFSNDLESDWNFLQSFHEFLDELSETSIRYFLEVFNPQIDIGISEEGIPDFVNDSIVRSLAGLTSQDWPEFLKIPFNGPRAMEDLCRYDPCNLIVGVLGGGAGTTRDTLELVRQSEKFGARVALFGRKILLSEDSEKIITLMRAVVRKDLGTAEAVKEFHAHLAMKGIMPLRDLEEDLQVTESVLMADL